MNPRTTRVVALGTAVLAYVLLVGIAAGVGTGKSTDRLAYEERGAWYARGVVHVGDHTVEVSGIPLTIQVGYTSEGALVYDRGDRYDADTDSVTTGDATLTLITPSGDSRPLSNAGVSDLDLLPGTDPTLPYAAFVRRTDAADTFELVMVDVRDGSEDIVGEPFVDPESSGYYPLHLSPDLVTAPNGGELEWRTGDPVETPDYRGTVMHWNVGRDAVLATGEGTRDVRVLDRADGHELLTVTTDPVTNPAGYVSLSPDGRWVGEPIVGGFVIHEVASGETRTFDGDWAFLEFGWTPDGHVVGTTGNNAITVCDPETGRCEGTGVELSSPQSSWDVPRGAFTMLGY